MLLAAPVSPLRIIERDQMHPEQQQVEQLNKWSPDHRSNGCGFLVVCKKPIFLLPHTVFFFPLHCWNSSVLQCLLVRWHGKFAACLLYTHMCCLFESATYNGENNHMWSCLITFLNLSPRYRALVNIFCYSVIKFNIRIEVLIYSKVTLDV